MTPTRLLVPAVAVLALFSATNAATRLTPRAGRPADKPAGSVPSFSTNQKRDGRKAAPTAAAYRVDDGGAEAGPSFASYRDLSRGEAVAAGVSAVAEVALGGPGFPVGDRVVRSIFVSTDGAVATAATDAEGVRFVAFGARTNASVFHRYDAALGANLFQWKGTLADSVERVDVQARLFDDGTVVYLYKRLGAEGATAFTGVASADPNVAGRSYARVAGAADRTAVRFSPVTAGTAAVEGGCPSVLSQTSSTVITALNSVSCNNGIGHTDNSYYRAFTLSSLGVTGTYNVTSVDIGIESADSGGTRGTGQPITVNIYSGTGTFPTGFPGSLTLAGTASVSVADQSGTILNVPITAAVAAANQLVIEVFTPNGEVAGNLFFIGSNAAAESGPSYLRAADCGITTPTATSAIGFPTMHIVLSANGSCSGSGGCTVTAPANVTTSNDPNQCGAVVTYPAPTSTGTCGTITCSPASGSFFPKGTTTVTCTPATGSSASFTVTVNDTQSPAITCPANVTSPATGTQGMTDGATVTYAAPTVTDNCPGSSAPVCSPASGSFFAVGTTTVTCSTTDGAANSASCSFTVSVSSAFNLCFFDDATGDSLSFVTTPASPLYRSWQYRVAATGQIIQGTAESFSYVPGHSLVAYDHDASTVRMDANANFGAHTATATVTLLPSNVRFVLRDRNTDGSCR